MQFHKLKLERFISYHSIHGSRNNYYQPYQEEKKKKRELSFVQDLTWLSQNQLEFRKWNKEANWSVQVCRLDCSKRFDNLIQDVFVVPCPERGTVTWYTVAASVGSAVPTRQKFWETELGLICYQGDVWLCVCLLKGELKITNQTLSCKQIAVCHLGVQICGLVIINTID